MSCYRRLDHPAGDLPGVVVQDGGAVPEPFISVIGGLFPIALWGRTSLHNSVTERPQDRGARGALPLASLGGASGSRSRCNREARLAFVSL